jgi:hypothetical protein
VTAEQDLKHAAEEMLSGRLGITAGCRRMKWLLHREGRSDDPELTIRAVDSESDGFWLPEMEHLCEPRAFAENTAQRLAYEELVRDDVLSACRRILVKLAEDES